MPPKFGTLAETLRSSLVDFRRMDMPVEEFTNPAFMRRFRERCRAVLPVLNRAHRMVLSEDFTHLAGRFSVSDPFELLAAWTQIARMPFETLWIEWPEKVRYAAVNNIGTDDIAAKLHMKGAYEGRSDRSADIVGMLISPAPPIEGVPDVQLYRASISWMQEGLGAQLCPVGFIFSFKNPPFGPGKITSNLSGPDGFGLNPAANEEIKQRVRELRIEAGKGNEQFSPEETKRTEELLSFFDQASTPLGRGYLANLYRHGQADGQTWTHVTDALTLATFVAPTLLPPVGTEMQLAIAAYEAMGRSADADLARTHDSVQKAIVSFSNEVNGDWRFLLAILTLLNVRPETDLNVEHVQPKKHVYVKGRFFPAYEYRVVTITAPVTEAINRLRKQVARVHQPRRWHTVRGTWAHSRKVGDRNCNHSYVRSTNKKGEPIGSDQFRCTACGAKRWWVQAHPRGDRRIGVVDKGYEVEGAKAGEHPERKHRTIEVVDLDNIREALAATENPPEEEAKPS